MDDNNSLDQPKTAAIPKLIPNKRHFWRGPIPLNIRLSGILIAKIILFFKTQANKYIFFDLWSIFLDLKF